MDYGHVRGKWGTSGSMPPNHFTNRVPRRCRPSSVWQNDTGLARETEELPLQRRSALWEERHRWGCEYTPALTCSEM